MVYPSRVIQKQTDCFGSSDKRHGVCWTGGLLGQLLFFSEPTEPKFATYHILQKNQFAALARVVFIVCEAGLVLIVVCLVFIVVVPDIKHLPCQFFKTL